MTSAGPAGFELSGIVRVFFQNAYLGYWVGAPYAGRGYMTEGMRLLFRHAAFTMATRTHAELLPAVLRVLFRHRTPKRSTVDI